MCVDMNSVLNYLKLYLKDRDDGVCTRHSTTTIKLLSVNCEKCTDTLIVQSSDSESDGDESIMDQSTVVEISRVDRRENGRFP